MCHGKNAIDLKAEVPIMKKQFGAECDVDLNGGKYIFENSFTSILLELTLEFIFLVWYFCLSVLEIYIKSAI